MRGSMWRWMAAFGLALLVGSCQAGDSLAPVAEVDAGALIVTPVDMHTIQVRWGQVDGARSYEIERRANLAGEFTPVTSVRNLTSYVDRALNPGTIYGYRMKAVNDFGQVIGMSTVAGGRTPEEPGILVRVRSALGGDPAKSVDSTGYRIKVKGEAVDQTLPVDVNGDQKFQPVAAGIYSVTIEDVAPQCDVDSTVGRLAVVTDQGLNTVTPVSYSVRCRDRSRGRIKVRVAATGDTTDANGFKIVVSGVAEDKTLPPAERAFVSTQTVPPSGATVSFENLLPGTYSVVIDDVSPACAVGGTKQRDALAVKPLGDLLESFDVACRTQGGNKAYTLAASWSNDTAAVGAKVRLSYELDLRSNGVVDVAAYQFRFRTPVAVVRLDSVVAPGGWSLVTNSSTPGDVLAIATQVGGQTGLVRLLDAYYTVVGANGDRAASATTILNIGQNDGTKLTAQISRSEDTVVVGNKVGGGTGGGGGGGGGGTVNQAPRAFANGPYAGQVGQSVSFTAAGSNDPDGSIVSYAWAFGDGQAGSGQTASHIYAAAGSYTATLTVTDDKGATGTAQPSVTIASSGGGSGTTPFTWNSGFGALNPSNGTIPLTVTLDLTTDIPETPGAEQLQDFTVDSLKWDPAVLQFYAFQVPGGTSPSVDFSATARGVLRFSGTVAGQSSGVVPIATVLFKPAGAAGNSTTTRTFLGAIIGKAATGSYNYRSRIVIAEGTYTSTGGGGSSPTTVAGTVSSPQLGNLAGVTVSLGSGLSATTASNGTYTVSNVSAGTYSASVANLPAGCTVPTTKSVTVGSTPVTGVDFSITCTAQSQGVAVSGTVTSSTGGLAGVTVRLSSSLSATTAANGGYTIQNVPAGTYSATLSTLPSGCNAPAAQTVTVTSSPVANVNFTVACQAQPQGGTIAGSIGFAPGSQTPSLATVTVTVTPSGGSAVTGNPSAAGQFSIANVAVGSGAGTVAISTLPSGCTATAASQNYSGLTAGGTVTVPAFQINCTGGTPSNKYNLTVSWSAIANNQATMTLAIDMTGRNDPNNNGTGPDQIGGFQSTVTYPTTRLSGPVCTAQSGFNGVINVSQAAKVTAVLTYLAGATGSNVGLVSCKFDVAGSGPTTVQMTGVKAGDPTGTVNFSSFINLVINPLP